MGKRFQRNKAKGEYHVYTRNCAGFLLMKGYALIRVEPNPEYPDRLAYIFKWNDNMEETVEVYRRCQPMIAEFFYRNVG